MKEKKYEEIGTNYRFFLGWRHASFAGDLVILYGVISLTMSFYKEPDSRPFAWIVPALAFPIGLLLWIIDVRTRVLYLAAIKAGKVLEGNEGGVYTQIEKDAVKPVDTSLFKKFTHTLALWFLFIGSSIALIVAAIVLYISTR